MRVNSMVGARSPISVADGEAGDEREIDRVLNRPAFKRSDEHAGGNHQPEEHGQDGPDDAQAKEHASMKFVSG